MLDSKKTTNPFSLYLQQTLKQKGWSVKKFADELDEDDGTVRAVVRGARSISTKHPLVQKISELLGISQKDLILLIVESKKFQTSTNKEKLPKNHQEYIKPLTEVSPIKKDIIIKDYRPKKKKTGIIKGIQELRETFIFMLENLPLATEGKDQIFITFQGAKSIFEDQPHLQERWNQARSSAMKKGYKITHLIRLDSTFRRRTYELVSGTFQLLKYKDLYEPLCFKNKSILMAPYGLVLALGQEALFTLSTQESHATDAAIYTKEESQVSILAEHFQSLKEQTEQIFSKYETYEQPDFMKVLHDADDEPGDRIIITRRLSEITRPINWYDPNHNWAKDLLDYLENNSPPGTDLSQHIENRRQRANALQKHLDAGKYCCRYIYPKSCIEEFVNSGKPEPYYFEANREEKIEQLQRMADLLKYPTYEMALIDEEGMKEISPTFCEVQGNHIFFGEVWSERNQERISTWYFTQERVIVRAFQEHLSKFWNKISDDCKNRFYVSEWIKQQIHKLG